MSSEIRRGSADDPGETAAKASGADNRAIHGANPQLTRGEIADLPDYDGDVPPPLPGADPGNEDAGEPAETTGLGEGYHSPEELRAWLSEHRAGYGSDTHGSDARGADAHGWEAHGSDTHGPGNHGADAHGSDAHGSDARGETAGAVSKYGSWADVSAESDPLTRGEIADLPDYDGDVPPPLPGADPGNEDAGEPAETTGLGEGHHTAAELRAWLARNVWNADDGRTGDGGAGDTGAGDSGADGAGDGRATPADESGDAEGTEQARPGTRAVADAATAQPSQRGEETADGKPAWAQGENVEEQRSEDQVPGPGQAPDADEGQPSGPQPPNDGPDSVPDDPMAALEQRMLHLMEARDAERDRRDAEREAAHLAELDRLKAENQATAERLDEFEARHEQDQAKIQELETGREQDRQKIDDLQAKVEEFEEAKQDPGKPDIIHGESEEKPYARKEGQPRVGDSEMSQETSDRETPDRQTDRPGWLSNAKLAFYGATAAGLFSTGAAEFLSSSPVLAAAIGGAIAVAWAIPPVLRERKRKHGD